MTDEPRVKVPIRPDGLQLDDHPDWQRLFWRAERIGWAGFALVIGMALAGLTGRGGWLAVAEHRAGAALVEAPRFSRRGETALMEVAFGIGAGRHLLAIGGGFLVHYEVVGIVPPPLRSVAAGDGLALQFDTVGTAPHRVRLYLRAREAGLMRAQVVIDGAGVGLRSLILP